MDSWLHHNKHELILSWGPPQRTTSDGADGEVLIYSQRIYSPGANYGNGMSVPATDYYKNSMFYVNAKGEIYGWQSNGTANPPTQVDVYLH